MKKSFIGLVLTLFAAGQGWSAAAARSPNFVVIMTEAQGWSNTSVAMDDRSPESKSPIFRTPAVERLAREGMRFAYGYAASPRCTPSRAALLTGKSPAVLHMTFVGIGRDSTFSRTGSVLIPPEPLLELPTAETTLPELLKNAGYITAHFGKWHLGRVSPLRHGFDESDGPTNNGGPDNVANPNPKQAEGMTDRGIAFIARAAQAGRPFYLQLSHYPNQEQKAANRGAVGAAADAAEVDKTVSRLLDALDRLGLTENTFVIYTADHGAPGRGANEPLNGGKGGVLEGGLRVPFLIRGPGVAANVCSQVPVTAMDILPSVVELAGVKAPIPAGVEGGSLVGLWRDKVGAGVVSREREELIFHFPHYDSGNLGPASAIMVGSYKLIHVYENGGRFLYDLSRDASERRNLAVSMPEKVADLDGRLAAYLKNVNAQMAVRNPDYDPTKKDSNDLPPGPRGGVKGGRPRANP